MSAVQRPFVLILLLLFATSPSFAQPSVGDQKLMELFIKYSNDLCKDIPLGTYSKEEILTISKGIARDVKAVQGGTASAQITESSTFNVLQAQLPAAIRDLNECKSRVFQLMMNSFFSGRGRVVETDEATAQSMVGRWTPIPPQNGVALKVSASGRDLKIVEFDKEGDQCYLLDGAVSEHEFTGIRQFDNGKDVNYVGTPYPGSATKLALVNRPIVGWLTLRLTSTGNRLIGSFYSRRGEEEKWVFQRVSGGVQ